jgi:hypothetical protein
MLHFTQKYCKSSFAHIVIISHPARSSYNQNILILGAIALECFWTHSIDALLQYPLHKRDLLSDISFFSDNLIWQLEIFKIWQISYFRKISIYFHVFIQWQTIMFNGLNKFKHYVASLKLVFQIFSICFDYFMFTPVSKSRFLCVKKEGNL